MRKIRTSFRPYVPWATVFCYAVNTDEGDRNEFGIPDVPNEPCLLLCPHITLLALFFADQAFAAPSLTSPEHLYRLCVDTGQKQLPLPLKEEIADTPLFRRCTNTVRSAQISEEQALTDYTLRQQMTDLRTITGMELLTGPYTFRRGNGHALDSNSKWARSGGRRSY